MDGYQFDRGLKAVREFAWEVLADEYIELVKGRLYGEGEARAGAVRTLETALDLLCRLLAPFVPSFAEEVFSYLGRGSVHAQPWPEFAFDDPEALADGELLASIVAEVRRYKHERGMALNAPLGQVTVMAPRAIEDGGDAGRALNADLHWQVGTGGLSRELVDVKFDMAVVGKAFRKDAPAFMAAVRALPKETLAGPVETVELNGADGRGPGRRVRAGLRLARRRRAGRPGHGRRRARDRSTVALIAPSTKAAISSRSFSASTSTNREGSASARPRYAAWTFSRTPASSKCSRSLVRADPAQGLVHGEDEEEGLVRGDRPAVVEGPEPAERVGQAALEHDRLVRVPRVRVPVRDHEPPLRERGPDHGRDMGRVVRGEEEGLGDGVDLLGNPAPDGLAGPGRGRLAREDRVEVGEPGFEEAGRAWTCPCRRSPRA